MQYSHPLWRPPSEAYSLILQVTLGCSHNKCTFCSSYRTKTYREKTIEEINEHIEAGVKCYPSARRIFLADGNAISMDTEKLLYILKTLYDKFPGLERVSSYASPTDFIKKSAEELKQIREAGLSLLYVGVESGSAQILKKIKKGVNPEKMIEGCKKAMENGFQLSCTLILGLGGKELSEEHALESARVINAIDPQYLGILTLMLERLSEMKEEIKTGRMELLNPLEIFQELRLMISSFELTNCVFRTNHASNYLPLQGTLSRDKDKLTTVLDKIISSNISPEEWKIF